MQRQRSVKARSSGHRCASSKSTSLWETSLGLTRPLGLDNKLGLGLWLPCPTTVGGLNQVGLCLVDHGVWLSVGGMVGACSKDCEARPSMVGMHLEMHWSCHT